jgi:hypothetical protein
MARFTVDLSCSHQISLTGLSQAPDKSRTDTAVIIMATCSFFDADTSSGQYALKKVGCSAEI